MGVQLATLICPLPVAVSEGEIPLAQDFACFCFNCPRLLQLQYKSIAGPLGCVWEADGGARDFEHFTNKGALKLPNIEEVHASLRPASNVRASVGESDINSFVGVLPQVRESNGATLVISACDSGGGAVCI